ncbi:MAG: alpha/beta fold hydrolase [Anaerolineae bacterium]|nr:alpha/beta fold hydrolase [Anaerolineae bacterium]MCI0608757.1 alpha/beta fold hydrolase [Anaerolineae bacterium]
MKNWPSFRRLILFSILIMAACAPTAPTVTLAPTQQPSATLKPLTLTPVESAFAPGNPTAAPLEDIIRTHSVTFDTADGATVSGELYGSGKTAVIFSVMGNCKPGWREFAQLTAAQGFMALTYQWRGCEANSVDQVLIQKFVEDARAAIAFVRDQGAEKIILVGASLGGCASAKLAVESQASGLVVLASPPSIPQWGFEIEPADLDTDIPKLFITAENDDTVPSTATRELYDLAAEPKEWHTYPGTAHGTDLFEGESGAELQQRILSFIQMITTEKK